jgi:hypothetical protein
LLVFINLNYFNQKLQNLNREGKFFLLCSVKNYLLLFVLQFFFKLL